MNCTCQETSLPRLTVSLTAGEPSKASGMTSNSASDGSLAFSHQPSFADANPAFSRSSLSSSGSSPAAHACRSFRVVPYFLASHSFHLRSRYSW